MTAKEAEAFIREHGVVLASAKGAVPRLTEAIVGEPIKGSWWAHPKGRQIFAVLKAVTESEDILVCRAVEGKVTYVHRRLWPALVRAADRFPPNWISQIREEHTSSGKHIIRENAFPNWVPSGVKEQAERMGEQGALVALGSWALVNTEPLELTHRKRRNP
jgi:hypothetical protein